MGHRGLIKTVCLLLLIGGMFLPYLMATPEPLRPLIDFATGSGLWSLLLLLFAIRIADEVGVRLLAKLGWPAGEHKLESFVFAVALGLGVLATLVFALGVLQLYQPFFIRILFITASTAALFLPSSQDYRAVWSEWPDNWQGRALVLFNLLWIIIYLLAALAPETAFDALNYHLGIPELFTVAGGFVETPHLVYSYFPFLIEMLYTLALLIDSPILAGLFHFLAGVLCALGIIAFGKRYLTLFWGLFASALFLASPIVGFLMQTAYADLSLALYAFLSFYAFTVWRSNRSFAGVSNQTLAQSPTSSSGLVFSGLFAGLAFASKYTGILVPGIIALAILVEIRDRRSLKAAVSRLALFQAATLVFAAPWLLKNLVLTGNPIAPLLSDLLPLATLNGADYYQWLRTTNNWGGYSGNFIDYLRTPWLLTIENNIFMGRPGPIILPGALLGAILGWRCRKLRPLILLAWSLFILSLLGSKLVRYHTLSFPLFCLVIAGALWTFKPSSESGLSRIQGVVAGAMLLLSFTQLPWFLSLTGSTINTVDPAKLKIFSSSDNRWRFLERKLVGEGGQELYRKVNQTIPPGKALLAIVPAYQAFLNRPVYMAPNSSPAIEMTEKLFNYSLAASGLGTNEAKISTPVKARFWQVRIPASQLTRPAEFYRPRFFFESNGGYLEIPVFSIRRSEDDYSLQIECNLGASRDVDRIWMWSEPLSSYGKFEVNSGDSRHAMASVEAQWNWIASEPVSRAELIRLLEGFDVDMILYPVSPELAFIDEALCSPENTRFFEEVYSSGGKKLLRLRGR